MAVSFDFFSDANLTTVLTELASTHLVGSAATVDQKVYFGSAQASRKAEADSSPGVDQITISIVDADNLTGQPATAVKLATTQAGLDSAVAGASLDIGTQVLSGSVNAIEVWVRTDETTDVVGNYTDLSLQTNTLRETAV